MRLNRAHMRVLTAARTRVGEAQDSCVEHSMAGRCSKCMTCVGSNCQFAVRLAAEAVDDSEPSATASVPQCVLGKLEANWRYPSLFLIDLRHPVCTNTYLRPLPMMPVMYLWTSCMTQTKNGMAQKI